MSRRFWTRAALTVVTGVGLATVLPAAEKTPAANYQPNDVIVLKTPGKPDQKVTVVRSTRRIDGRVFTEVKDSAGKVFTMIDDAPHGAVDRASDVLPAGLKEPLPKAKARENEVPPASAVAMADSKRRRLFGRDDEEPQPAPAPAAEPEKKPGLLSRIFGSKDKDKEKEKPAQQMTPPPSQAYTPPAPTYTPEPTPPVPMYGTAPRPVFQPPASMPPSPLPVVTAPPVSTVPGVPAQMPGAPGAPLAPWTQVRSPEPVPMGTPPVKAPTPGVTTGTTRINLTPEPTRPTPPSVTAPVAPPTVVVPSVPSPPVVVPSVPSIPMAPPVSVPSVPFPPQVSIPALPVPAPTPQSMRKPLTNPGIRTVSFVEPREEIAVLEELRGEVTILKQSKSAAERVLSIRTLANGRYGWRPEVKAVLAQTARLDSAPAVRAQCILELRELGYYDAGFLTFLADCERDTDAVVRDAAKAALAKLNRPN